MMTSSNGNIFRVTGPLWGESTGPRWNLSQRPVTRSFDVFIHKRLSKHSRSRWFETPSRSLWCHCNVHGYTAYRVATVPYASCLQVVGRMGSSRLSMFGAYSVPCQYLTTDSRRPVSHHPHRYNCKQLRNSSSFVYLKSCYKLRAGASVYTDVAIPDSI